jgi:transcriptional regulator with XRE-family HTH domain
MISKKGGFMHTKKLLGARIKELRKLKGLTQDKLSELVSIESKHLSRIEVGGSYPSLDTLEKIAKALKVEMKDFFEFEHHGKSSKELKETIGSLLVDADQNKLRTALKIIRAIIK